MSSLNLVDFIQLGVAGIAVVAIVIIVKEFLKSNREKDEVFIKFIERQEENFSDLVKNHLSHNNEVMEGLKDIIKELYVWLKKNNK